MRNAKQWSVLVPIGLGPFDRFLPLRCGDLESVRDRARTLPQSVYERSDNGERVEIARLDDGESGLLNLSCTELAADRLDNLRAVGCPFPLQRRACPVERVRRRPVVVSDMAGIESPATYYEHYTAVNLGERALENPTASGVAKNDTTPTVAMPGMYGTRYLLTDTPALGQMADPDETPINIVYCSNPLCGNCTAPCQKLYALVRVQVTDEETEMALRTSEDGGYTWQPVTNMPVIEGATAFLFCYQGSRLFVGDRDHVWYSDYPENEEWWLIPSLEGVNPQKMISDGRTIFLLQLDNGVWRSVDDGLTWKAVLVEDTLTTGVMRDISLAGNVIATFGESAGGVAEICYSLAYGDYQTWQSYTDSDLPEVGAIGLANPNPFDPDRFWVYVIGTNTGNDLEIWKAEGLQNWRRLYLASLWGGVCAGCQIELAGDGYIGWFHAYQATGINRTLRTSDGGRNLVDVSHLVTGAPGSGAVFKLAVCPTNPDKAVEMWNGES